MHWLFGCRQIWLPCVAVEAVRPTEMRCESFRRRLVWAVPCSAAQRSAMQCSAVRCSAVQCDGPAGDGTNTSMIVMEIRQVTNEALLKASHPARALMATKASFVRHIAAMPPPGHTNTHTHAHARAHTHTRTQTLSCTLRTRRCDHSRFRTSDRARRYLPRRYAQSKRVHCAYRRVLL